MASGEFLVRSCRLDFEPIDSVSSGCAMTAVEGKSMPTSARRKMRRRFGYVVAMTLIGFGALLNVRLLLPTFALASVVSISVVGIAVLVQMPMQYLRSRRPERTTTTSSDDAVIS